MQIENRTALVTGANRGIGHALVTELLDAGARRVYATARRQESLAAFANDERVVALALDVTDPASVQRAAATASGVELLFNNAGTLASASVLNAERDALMTDLETNFFGPITVVRALLPQLEVAPEAAVVNLLTIVSVASMPGLGGYCASKAAAWSLTQSLRAELAPRGVSVHGVFPGPVDTDMLAGIEMPKTAPADVARAILEGVVADAPDILPDPMSQQAYAAWLKDPKGLEAQFGAM